MGGVQLFWSLIFFVSFIFKGIYPTGSKCKALRLGVHLILLYFIEDLTFNPEDIFFNLMVEGGRLEVDGVRLFWSSIFFIILF